MIENKTEEKVLALKYRPKRFEDLIGQATISQTLSLALDTNRLSHAYLFSGLRGSGKTSTARIMAKALLCSKGPTSKPCEVCEHCKSANSYKHLDIIEMDAASNRGIDDIKDLIEHTKYKPSSGRFKIFIIDEVHMLTTQAFNALLKTLEEPPDFVKFILATTDPLKLPATILSRTQHFRFNKIAPKDVLHHLSHILNEENIDFQAPALEILTRSGQGSLRDTLTLLDQAIIFSKGDITVSAVVDMLGLIEPELMERVFDIILKKEDILNIVKELENYEISQVCDEMAIYLKQKMLDKDAKYNILLFDRFFRILGDSKYLLNLNCDDGFVIILTLLKMIEATNLKTIDEIINQVEQIEIQPTKKHLNPTKKIIEHVKKEEVEATIIKPLQVEKINDFTTPFDEVPLDNNIEKKEKNTKKDIQEHELNQNLYEKLINKVYERDVKLGELFEKNFIYKSFENKKLIVISYAKGEDRKFLFKYYGILKMCICDVFGNDIDIEFIKEEAPFKKKDEIQDKVDETLLNLENLATEDMQGGSGCVADMTKTSNEDPAQKELELNDVLNSSMLNTAKELLHIKKITVKSKN